MTSAPETSRKRPRLTVVAETALFSAAAVSLGYAAITALGGGKDLATFQEIGRAWVAGVYQNSEGQFLGPPPYASVLFAAFAFLSFGCLRAAFVIVNLAATAAILLMVKRLWGEAWPVKAHLCLAAFLICWAPFRVTLRNGQLSLIATALVLGALLAWKRGARMIAGVLLGLSLCKYPLTLPFAAYFVWRKEWKIAAVSVLTLAGLTEAFALRFGLSAFDVTRDYVRIILTHASTTNDRLFTGGLEIGPVFFALIGVQRQADLLDLAVIVVATLAMCLVFWRSPGCERFHLTILTFFSLWYVYHRIYDAVICVIPAAVFVDLIARDKFRKAGWIGIGALGLLAISIPGLLTEWLHLSAERLAANPAGFLGLHFERLLVFAIFWASLMFLWKVRPSDLGEHGHCC